METIKSLIFSPYEPIKSLTNAKFSLNLAATNSKMSMRITHEIFSLKVTGGWNIGVRGIHK